MDPRQFALGLRERLPPVFRDRLSGGGPGLLDGLPRAVCALRPAWADVHQTHGG
jgi:hypothetical protein